MLRINNKWSNVDYQNVNMIKMILIFIFFSLPLLNYYGLVWSVQDSNFTITINPGATNNNSKNLIAPRNITVLEGSTIIWLNNDSTSTNSIWNSRARPIKHILWRLFRCRWIKNITLDNAGVSTLTIPLGIISKVK